MVALGFIGTQSPALAVVTPGKACYTVKKTLMENNLKFTCIKVGKKLLWDKGVPVRNTPQVPAIPKPSMTTKPSQTAKPSATRSTITIIDSNTPSPNATPIPTPTPTSLIQSDKTLPMISDLVVPLSVKAGSPFQITYRASDDVGLDLFSTGNPFTFAYLYKGTEKIGGIFPAVLVSGSVKDGKYSITFTATQGLSGNYQVRVTAYDKGTVPSELISPDINIVP